MDIFKKGDILAGAQRSFSEAHHPIVYINGSSEAPMAVVLTHSSKFRCNIQLAGDYGEGKGSSYFVGHLIEKVADWGPYKKIGALNPQDLVLVEQEIGDRPSMTWKEYQMSVKGKCPVHS